MKHDYAYTPENESFVAKAMGKELRVKYKDSIEVCAAIQGMKALKARDYLQTVLDKKAYIPVKRVTRQSGHKHGMKPFGAQPVKTVEAILGILDSAIANAEFKGLDAENCTVVSAIALRGPKMRRLRPSGRYAVYATNLSSVQIFLEEISE